MSTLSELRTRARRRADAVGNNFFSDAEINDYINVGLGELHDVLVSKFEDYYVSSVSFTLTPGTSTYSFSSISLTNFYKLLGVDASSGNNTVKVKRFSFSDRNRFSSDAEVYNNRGYAAYESSIQGENIKMIPEPDTNDTITVHYVPSFTALASDGSSVSNSIELNWEEYAVVTAAIKMRQKEETSTTSLERELERIEARIDAAASNRDAAEPFGITDEDTGVLPYYHWSL